LGDQGAESIKGVTQGLRLSETPDRRKKAEKMSKRSRIKERKKKKQQTTEKETASKGDRTIKSFGHVREMMIKRSSGERTEL